MIRYAAAAPQFTKIAVTVPTETYAVVERLRRRLGKSRSAVVALALEEWVRGVDLAEADRRYVEGYLRTPEAVDEIGAVAAQATSSWSSWSPGEPLRAEDSSPRPAGKPASRTAGAARTGRASRAKRAAPKRSRR
jgi:ribbon-helix-helix CopG family protein